MIQALTGLQQEALRALSRAPEGVAASAFERDIGEALMVMSTTLCILARPCGKSPTWRITHAGRDALTKADEVYGLRALLSYACERNRAMDRIRAAMDLGPVSDDFVVDLVIALVEQAAR